MNEYSRKWMKPLVSMLLLGSVAIFSGCGGSDAQSAPVEATESRTSLAHAGEAEVPTGIHYGNTLFDSADKKCQMCHFELYDTWKTSMHAKSWTDGIFQSKYQDYLRIKLSDLNGNMGTITGNGSSSTLRDHADKGNSKVCLKCHAPGAYYSGDFNITVAEISSGHTDINSSVLAGLKAANQKNIVNPDPTKYTGTKDPTTVAAVGKDGKLYTATYHIGNAANREGINCATCHSVESIRLMGEAGTPGLEGVRDGGMYVLKNKPTGNARTDIVAGDTIYYDKNASKPGMNAFFSLIGPDVFIDPAATPKGTGVNDMSIKLSDGRYTFASIEVNGTNGKTHYTGGPFYGPFGITGTDNSNADDDSDRMASSLGKDVFQAKNNHFSHNAKALCLSCHQRSAGAVDPATGGNQMELCSTWNAVTSGTANNWESTPSSPKCTNCHMPRLSDKTVLHKWNKPNELFQRDELLTGYFDPADGNNYGEEDNPIVGKWMNDHGFIGANKLTGANYVNKIKSGFDADVTATIANDILTVNTTFLNKTAHMLPGAHPMRRMLTRVIVTDSTGMVEYDASTTTGNSTFEGIVNTVVPSENGATVNKTGTGRGSVAVEYDATRIVDVTGIQPDLNGSTVSSQEFNSSKLSTLAGADNTVKKLYVDASGITRGEATALNIIDDANTSTFTRVYGRETGKKYNATTGNVENNSGTFIVRPGFDSNTVVFDNRLVPNEKETYTIKYDVTGKTGITVTYKVYYMLTGANGFFPTGEDGWYKVANATTDRIDEVFTKTVNP